MNSNCLNRPMHHRLFLGSLYTAITALIRQPLTITKPEWTTPKCDTYYETRSKNSEIICRTSAHNHMGLGDRKWMLEAMFLAAKNPYNSINFCSEMQTFCAK